jgi:hypothetical protein
VDGYLHTAETLPGKGLRFCIQCIGWILFFFSEPGDARPAFTDFATISDRDVSELSCQEARKIIRLIGACL